METTIYLFTKKEKIKTVVFDFCCLAAMFFVPAISHADWEKDGIIPDLQAYADWDTFTFDNDPSIAAALELLGVK